MHPKPSPCRRDIRPRAARPRKEIRPMAHSVDSITAVGQPVDAIFRRPADENLRRFYADPERARRRLADMAQVDTEVAAKNRATVARLAYRPRFHNPGLAQWLHRIDVPTLLLWGAAD